MGIELKGVNIILKKLDNLSKIETKKPVEESSKEMQKILNDKIGKFSDNSNAIKIFKPKISLNSTYIEVGFKSTDSDWQKNRDLYLQNYGLSNSEDNVKEKNNVLWFTEAIRNSENEIKNKLKSNLKKQIQKCWKG